MPADPAIVDRLDELISAVYRLLYEQSKPKHVQELLAEIFREAGLLTLVFVPIYELIEQQTRIVRWSPFIIAMVLGIVILVAGIILERKRT